MNVGLFWQRNDSTTNVNLCLAIAFAISVAPADAQPQRVKATPSRPAPVALSARTIESKSKTEQAIQIQLAIGTEFEIYSERKHEFLLPLKVELLDAKFQPIESRIRYPKPKKIPFDKELGGDHFVYHGKPKFVATCAVDSKPAYVRVFFHGYSKRQY